MKASEARGLLLLSAIVWAALAMAFEGSMYPAMGAFLVFLHAIATGPRG